MNSIMMDMLNKEKEEDKLVLSNRARYAANHECLWIAGRSMMERNEYLSLPKCFKVPYQTTWDDSLSGHVWAYSEGFYSGDSIALERALELYPDSCLIRSPESLWLLYKGQRTVILTFNIFAVSQSTLLLQWLGSPHIRFVIISDHAPIGAWNSERIIQKIHKRVTLVHLKEENNKRKRTNETYILSK